MEGFIRFGTFVGLLVVMAMWEVWRPRRQFSPGKARRWVTNLTLTVFNTLVVRLTVGAVAVNAALFAQQRGWGVWSLLHVPAWGNIVLSLMVLDFAIYLQHVLSHALPVFWRLHRVHHTDLDVDVTTGLRFHPLEILLSMLYKAALVLLLGAHPAAVIAFEVILNAASEFNHANVRLPTALERILRKVVITPDLHRIHHSVVVAETNSNFGFSVPFWDRLCGTYRDQPSQPQPTMPLGLQDYRDARALGLGRLLLLPFVAHLGPTRLQQTPTVAGEPERHMTQRRRTSDRTRPCSGSPNEDLPRSTWSLAAWRPGRRCSCPSGMDDTRWTAREGAFGGQYHGC
jgi:sterol desaturase/sphingolipid hydroxylase (fatty acid hydroxylase superfamily)